MKIIGYVTVVLVSTVLVSTVVSVIWMGFVLSVLWGWFMTPLFGISTISIPYAIGFTLVVRFMTQTHLYDKDAVTDFGKKLTHSVITTLVSPAFVLLIGWIIHLFC